MSLVASLARLVRLRAQAGLPDVDPSKVWVQPPTAYEICDVCTGKRAEVGAKATRFTWKRAPGRRGAVIRGPTTETRWQAVKSAWNAWEQELNRP